MSKCKGLVDGFVVRSSSSSKFPTRNTVEVEKKDYCPTCLYLHTNVRPIPS